MLRIRNIMGIPQTRKQSTVKIAELRLVHINVLASAKLAGKFVRFTVGR